jgi:hypothetical protein
MELLTHIGRTILRKNTPLKLGSTLKKRSNKRRGQEPITRPTHRGTINVLRSEVDDRKQVSIYLANMTRIKVHRGLTEIANKDV